MPVPEAIRLSSVRLRVQQAAAQSGACAAQTVLATQLLSLFQYLLDDGTHVHFFLYAVPASQQPPRFVGLRVDGAQLPGFPGDPTTPHSLLSSGKAIALIQRLKAAPEGQIMASGVPLLHLQLAGGHPLIFTQPNAPLDHGWDTWVAVVRAARRLALATSAKAPVLSGGTSTFRAELASLGGASGPTGTAGGTSTGDGSDDDDGESGGGLGAQLVAALGQRGTAEVRPPAAGAAADAVTPPSAPAPPVSDLRRVNAACTHTRTVTLSIPCPGCAEVWTGPPVGDPPPRELCLSCLVPCVACATVSVRGQLRESPRGGASGTMATQRGGAAARGAAPGRSAAAARPLHPGVGRSVRHRSRSRRRSPSIPRPPPVPPPTVPPPRPPPAWPTRSARLRRGRHRDATSSVTARQPSPPPRLRQSVPPAAAPLPVAPTDAGAKADAPPPAPAGAPPEDTPAADADPPSGRLGGLRASVARMIAPVAAALVDAVRGRSAAGSAADADAGARADSVGSADLALVSDAGEGEDAALPSARD